MDQPGELPNSSASPVRVSKTKVIIQKTYLPEVMILITGGNGAIGSVLALKLKNQGKKVRILTLAQNELDSVLRGAGVEIFYVDVCHFEDCLTAMSGVDTVFHLAAVLFSPENPSRYHAINVGGTRTLLVAAEKKGVRHFILVSSISVTYPRRNAYSASKVEAEGAVRQSSIPWTIVRPCLVLDGSEYQAFEKMVLRLPVLLLPRGGVARKRPIHAEVLAETLAKLAGNPKAFSKTIALGGDKIVPLREMAESILRKQGSHKMIWPVPETLLRVTATLTEMLSKMFHRKISWLSHQSVDGLVYDAVPELYKE